MDKVGVSGLYYAGSHGFDIRTPSGEPVGDEQMARFDTFLPSLDQAEAELREELAARSWVQRGAQAVCYCRPLPTGSGAIPRRLWPPSSIGLLPAIQHCGLPAAR